MFEKRQTTTSVNASDTKYSTKNKKKDIFHKKSSIGIGIGISLTIITIIIQCVAFFTPHWKEVSPIIPSLYVDGVDALIRTEILHYFNSVHRNTRHSYGLFQRCEYPINNASQFNNPLNLFNKQVKTCTKNYLPSYSNEHFNECHSLPYYRFCSKTSEKIFDINNDYLRATFDISYSHKIPLTISCNCHYPSYVIVCHIIGIIALLFLIITCLLFSLFPFFTNEHYRLKIKSFAILSSVLSIIFLMINIIVILQHLEYESIEYLIAIQRHYQLDQIYKLSQDTKIAIDQFLSSIKIRVGYSTILAWVAFVLSIIDGIFIIATCKLHHEPEEGDTRDQLISSKHEENITSDKFRAVSSNSQSPLNSPNEKFRLQSEDEV